MICLPPDEEEGRSQIYERSSPKSLKKDLRRDGSDIRLSSTPTILQFTAIYVPLYRGTLHRTPIGKINRVLFETFLKKTRNIKKYFFKKYINYEFYVLTQFFLQKKGTKYAIEVSTSFKLQKHFAGLFIALC